MSAIEKCINWYGKTGTTKDDKTKAAARAELAELRRKADALDRIGREWGTMYGKDMVDLMVSAGVKMAEDTPDA